MNYKDTTNKMEVGNTEEQSLQRHIAQWNLSSPQLLTKTATSHIYVVTHSETKAILKILTAAGIKDEKNGATALRCFDGHGAVKLLQEDKDAHLLEYADGETLASLVQRDKDGEATSIIGDTLNSLHSVRYDVMPDSLTPLRTWFRSLFSMAQQRGDVYRQAAAVADRLLSNPQHICVLHGDIHHENIRQSARGWLAFDPKGLWGERTYDAANTFCNPTNIESLTVNKDRLMKTADILAQKLNINKDRLLSFVFAYCVLSASWSIEDGQSPEHALKMARLVENCSVPLV